MRLSVTEVVDRRKAQRSSHYLDLYNIMKGVTLAVAGVSLTEIAVSHWAFGRLILWVVAFAGAVLTYSGAAGGVALLNHRPSLPDILFPMLLSVAELILIYRPGLAVDGLHAEWMPTDWFALAAAWSFCCGCVIAAVARGLTLALEQDPKGYASQLADTVTKYRNRMRSDRWFPFISTAITLGAFLVWRLRPTWASHTAKVGVALVLLAFIIVGIRRQIDASRKVDEDLEKHSPAQSDAA
jgi:hypothetical protein